MELAKYLLKLCKENRLRLSKLAQLSSVPQATLHGWSTGRSVQNLHEILFGELEKGGSLRISEVFQGTFHITIESLEEG